MSSNLGIVVRPQELDLSWFVKIDRRFEELGFFPLRGRTGNSHPVGVVRYENNESEAISWPPQPESLERQKSLMVNYGLLGRRDQVHSFGLSYRFGSDRFLDTIWVGFSVPPFMADYSEAWVDMTWRVMAITEIFAENFTVESGSCMSDSGKTWMKYVSGSWVIVPDLPREAIDNWSLEGLQKWAAGEHNPVGQLNDSFVIVRPDAPNDVALLRTSPLDGCLLSPTAINDAFEDLKDEPEDRYRLVCWRTSSGIDDIVELFGDPDAELPPFEPDWFKAGDDEIVERNVVYFDLDPRYVVLFRQYRNGRTTFTRAGKRI
jgi:hypothetical protein